MRTLNDAGIPSPRGKRWTAATVETIVKNEVYTGVVILGERRREGAHEPLVTKANWRKVQATRAVSLSGTYRAGIAGGLLFAPGWDHPLSVAGRAAVPDLLVARRAVGGRSSANAGACLQACGGRVRRA